VLLCLLAAVATPGGAEARPSRAEAGCRALRAVFYAASDWIALAQGLAANESSCAQYSISVPPLVSDKTQMRSGQASQIRALGSNFHALAEIDVTAWQSWVASNSSTWYQAGVQARANMAAAGFDVTAGDSWAVNELSSAVRQGTGMSRQNMRDLVRGLYDGGGAPAAPSKGVVFVTGIGQSTASLDTYKARLESWLQDPGFWSDMGSYVSDFMQETYGDIREYGVPGADVPTRLSYLNAYLEHALQLASLAPSGTADGAKSFLEASYGALANAAWAWSSAYGYTAAPYDEMEDYVSAQVDAMRSFEASLGWSGDRIGFAWSPSNSLGLSTTDFNSEKAAILARLAVAIEDSADPTAPGAGACQSPWCTADVGGSAFTNAWSAFSTWTPTAAAFTSAPQSASAGGATGAITVELQVGGVATPLPVDSQVAISSSSAGGSFSTGSGGPWASTLDLTIPAGSTTASFFMFDSDVGTPTVTATVGGESTEQVESVTARTPPLAIAGAGNTVTYAGGGAPVVLDPALTVADSASSTLTSANVAISSGLDPGDNLTADTTGTSITASYSAGTLTLSGSDTVASYQAVLRTVAFSGTATMSGSREILWSAGDGSNTSSAVGTIGYAVPPDPPSDLVATAGDGHASVSFTPPGTDNGASITSYTATSSPGGKTASGGGSPITVAGLTDGTSYTFTVTATNLAGQGPASVASNSVTPTGVGGGGGGGGGGGAAPNLHVSVAASPTPHAVGDQFTYAVTVVNQGGSSNASTLTLKLPSEVTLLGTKVERGPGCSSSGVTVSCFLDFFPPALSSTVLVFVRVDALADLVLTTATTSNPGDSDPSDGAVSLTVTLSSPATLPSLPVSGASTSAHEPPRVIRITSVRVVKLRKGPPRLRFMIKSPKGGKLLVVLLDRRGHKLASWRKLVRRGVHGLTFALSPKARHKGEDRLRIHLPGSKTATLTVVVG
jgi:Domain of unknown function DUF11/Fibronectin type III domain